MKKVFTLLVLAALTLSGWAQTLNIGYPISDDYIWYYDGLYLDHDARVGACIKVTKSMYRDYIGGTDKYPQLGLDDEGAPADLKECFRHNGVIRRNLCTKVTGDALVIQRGDDYTFSVTYPAVTMDEAWNRDNMDVIAFVHLYDTNDRTRNYILNSGSLGMTTGVEDVNSQELKGTRVQGLTGVYNLNGQRLTAPQKGINTTDGRKVLR